MAELENVATERAAARERLSTVAEREKPLRVTYKMVRDTPADLTSIIDGANFTGRVAWVGSESEYIEIPADHAETHWRSGDAEAVSRSTDVSSWLRR